MRLAGKMATLIKATMRIPARLLSRPKDARARLNALEKELADIEAKEQELAELFKTAQAKAEHASNMGNIAEADALTQVARKLETQLDSQSVQAIMVSENVKVLSQALNQQKMAGEEASPTLQNSANDEPSSSSDAPSQKKDDLGARKSRLSE